jgi:uncharacterized protein (DUF1684 family)
MRPRQRRHLIKMKPAIISIIVLLFIVTGVSAQTYYGSTDLTTFREGRDKEFRDRKESPLKDDDFAKFVGLNYYPVDKNFRVTATLTRTPSENWFQMPTSSGKAKKFVKFGILEFKINGKPFVLSVYQIDPAISAKYPEYADLLFVPFKDLTSRTETYAGGRYIDVRMPKGNTVILDFNLAYNPNCAYGGEKWNCPIPPSENSLNVAITAGEKRFAYTGSERAH